MTQAHLYRGALLGAAVLLCTACSGGDPIGKGKGPTGLSVHYNGGTASEFQTIECAAFQLNANAVFSSESGSNSTTSDVTARVTWTSSNPGVIDVSNGDIPTYEGSGAYFPAGTVIARTTGNAIIRATYAESLSATFSVGAGALDSLRLDPVLTRMAPDSQTTFRLYVQPKDDQVEQDLTASAVWSVPTASSAASISGTSTVLAHGAPLDAPFVLEAHLYTCDRTISQTMQLGTVSGLRLSYEQPSTAAVPLRIDDRVRVDAAFTDASAPPQNLSAQIDVTNADGYAPDIASTITVTATTRTGSDGSAVLSSDSYLLVGGLQKDKPIKLKLTYDQAGLNLVTYTREYTFADIDLLDLRIDPLSTSVTYPALGQLHAYANFEDGIERPVTRFVNWTTTTPDLLTVVDTGTDGGLLKPENLSGTARVYADIDSAVQGTLEQNVLVDVHKQD